MILAVAVAAEGLPARAFEIEAGGVHEHQVEPAEEIAPVGEQPLLNQILIAGGHRLEAWKRCFGEQRPIPATIYPPDTPDALITILEIEENLLRKELTAAEREAQTIRLAAALKKLNGGQAGDASFEVGRGGRNWESDSQFSAGAPRPRQQGYGEGGRREGSASASAGEHEA